MLVYAYSVFGRWGVMFLLCTCPNYLYPLRRRWTIREALRPYVYKFVSHKSLILNFQVWPFFSLHLVSFWGALGWTAPRAGRAPFWSATSESCGRRRIYSLKIVMNLAGNKLTRFRKNYPGYRLGVHNLASIRGMNARHWVLVNLARISVSIHSERALMNDSP